MDLVQGEPRAAAVEMTTSPRSWSDEIKIIYSLNIYEHNTRTKTLIKYVTLWVLGFADCVASYFVGVSHSSARAAPHRVNPIQHIAQAVLDKRALGSVDYYPPVDLFQL